MKKELIGMTKTDLESMVKSLGGEAFRSRQLYRWLYKNLVFEFENMTDLPRDLRDRVKQVASITLPVVERERISRDGTVKVLLGLQDGQHVEMVMIPQTRAGRHRYTLCISSQVGCPIGCPFCATGRSGFVRNLAVNEITGQVLLGLLRLRNSNTFKTQGSATRLTNVVFMGMGEPFLNYDATMASLRRLTDSTGMNFGARRITISTVGIIPKIEKFSRESLQVNLAVSLHSADSELRSQIVPANRIYPLKNLISACRAYTELTHRRISFEYALIKDLNDTQPAAAQLAGLLKGMLCHVNLIALNPSKAYPLQGSSKEKVQAFADALAERGIPVTVRLRRGIEIQAGCGQLASSQNPL